MNKMKDSHLNTMGAFCGMRDVETLTRENLMRTYNIEQADVMVLFGGSILCGGDILAEAMRNQVAQKYIIVGGEGHTTPALRKKVQALYPEFDTSTLSEAEVFQGYLKYKYRMEPDYIETRSTNCGNNITRLLEVMEQHNLMCHSMILCQDATMQRRMSATLRKYRSDIQVINYATYQVEVKEEAGHLIYENEPEGMWEISRYASLLMGEIPRLRDNESGYGPKGYGYIAHVDIPLEVESAFAEIKEADQTLIRGANHQYKELLQQKSERNKEEKQ